MLTIILIMLIKYTQNVWSAIKIVACMRIFNIEDCNLFSLDFAYTGMLLFDYILFVV